MSQTIKHSVTDQTWTVTISSKVDDETELPATPATPVENVVIDLGEVRHVNSIGVRSWVQWIRSIFLMNPKAEIHLQRLPLIFIRLRQSFSDMIPETSRITSFFVSFYCPECMATHEELVETSGSTKDFHNVDHYPTCPVCKLVMDSEIDPAVYQQMTSAKNSDSTKTRAS